MVRPAVPQTGSSHTVDLFILLQFYLPVNNMKKTDAVSFLLPPLSENDPFFAKKKVGGKALFLFPKYKFSY